MMMHAVTPGPLNVLLASLAGWFLVVNALTFIAFYLDQRRALAGHGQMPGGTLVLLSTVGGWLGAQFGRKLFPGSNRRRAFATLLNLSVIPVLAIGGGLVAMDADWPGLIVQAKAQFMPAAADPVEAAATVPDAPAKPIVLDMKTPAVRPASVTQAADLPKRIGPNSAKTAAWHSR